MSFEYQEGTKGRIKHFNIDVDVKWDNYYMWKLFFAELIA